jgi:purine catabolism regulator
MNLEDISRVAKLVAGHGGIKNHVTFVTISEAPDFYQWVYGGEFVLSTLYAFKDYPELRAPAYRELAKRGVAAIAIKTKRFFDEIPADLIEIANEYDLPLFEVERETKFRQIIQAITAELNNEQTNLLTEVERHYQELAEVALVSGDFDQLIRGFGRRRKCSVLCFRSDYKLLGSYPSKVNDADIATIAAELDAYQLEFGEIRQNTTVAGWHVFPCVTRGQAIGFLVIADSSPLSEKLTLMAKQLTTFLTLKLIDQLDMEQRTLTALFDDILFKQNLKEDELRERLALHGLKRTGFYRVVIVREAQQSTDVANNGLFRTACAKIRSVLGEALLINKQDEAIFIAAGQQVDCSAPPVWSKQLGAEILSNQAPYCIGIGPSVALAGEIHSSYLIAQSTTRAGAAFHQGGLHYYSEFLARILLLSSIDTAENNYLHSMVTAPLLAQDQRYNTQLMKTLGALIFADDLEAAAATLFVHINTVRYRLNKVKQLTGYDFFAAKGRYTLTTAYLMYRFTH